MLDALQAKTKYRSTLAILLISVLWPFIAGILLVILGLLGIKNLGISMIVLGIIGLALLVWLIISLWKLAPQIGLTPWASLWTLVPIWGVFIVSMLFIEPLKYTGDNKPADERLPLTWPLIKDSLLTFKATISLTTKTTIWLLYGSLVLALATTLMTIWPVFGILYFLCLVAFTVLAIWVSIKLILEIKGLDQANKIAGNEGQTAKGMILPYIWVGILTSLMVISVPAVCLIITLISGLLAGAGIEQIIKNFSTLGTAALFNMASIIGAFLVILAAIVVGTFWIIYKSNQYSFVAYAFTLQGKKGMEALRESARIVKHRWWGLIWKSSLWGMAIGVGALAFYIIIGLVALILSFMPGQVGKYISQFIIQGLSGAFQVVLVPAILWFQYKLFKAFSNTAK